MSKETTPAAKQTATPWTYRRHDGQGKKEKRFELFDADGCPIAVTGWVSINETVDGINGGKERNAAFIVRAVNNLQPLINAFKKEHSHLGCDDGRKAGCESCEAIARAESR